MIESLENQEFTSKKRRFNRFDERDASAPVSSTVFKVVADVGKQGKRLLRAYRKDLFISKGEQRSPGQMVVIL